MRQSYYRELPIMLPPTMPDGSVAVLPIDQSAGNEHQLNCHGWPANNIQEYVNTESVSLQQAMLANIEKVAGQVDEFKGFTPEQKAALCFNRAAQTASEFCDEALRLDKVRERIEELRNVSSASKSSETITFDSKEVTEE